MTKIDKAGVIALTLLVAVWVLTESMSDHHQPGKRGWFFTGLPAVSNTAEKTGKGMNLPRKTKNWEAEREAAIEELEDAARQVQIRRALELQQKWQDAYEKVTRGGRYQ